jgi:hypothetical protein
MKIASQPLSFLEGETNRKEGKSNNKANKVYVKFFHWQSSCHSPRHEEQCVWYSVESRTSLLPQVS